MKQNRARNWVRRRGCWPIAVALGLVVALTSSPAWSESPGRCAKVEVPWPIVLPDGSAHEAGSLRVCLQQMWTPAAGLHEVRVNGTAIGLFMSRVGKSENPAEPGPIVIFQRNGTDEHYLVGYAWPDGETMRTYALHKFGKVTNATARRLRLPLLDSPDNEILLAALDQ
ncbi:MAG: hypothetical protein ACYSVY_27280 [Planctomycetota bacterium]|jgi:hypothetical protein